MSTYLQVLCHLANNKFEILWDLLVLLGTTAWNWTKEVGTLTCQQPQCLPAVGRVVNDSNTDKMMS